MSCLGAYKLGLPTEYKLQGITSTCHKTWIKESLHINHRNMTYLYNLDRWYNFSANDQNIYGQVKYNPIRLLNYEWKTDWLTDKHTDRYRRDRQINICLCLWKYHMKHATFKKLAWLSKSVGRLCVKHTK